MVGEGGWGVGAGWSGGGGGGRGKTVDGGMADLRFYVLFISSSAISGQ